MKRRVSKVLNFFAFNLLFFALYLNFVHKDNNAVPIVKGSHVVAPVTGTVLVENPEQYLNRTSSLNNLQRSASIDHASTAQKTSIN